MNIYKTNQQKTNLTSEDSSYKHVLPSLQGISYRAHPERRQEYTYGTPVLTHIALRLFSRHSTYDVVQRIVKAKGTKAIKLSSISPPPTIFSLQNWQKRRRIINKNRQMTIYRVIHSPSGISELDCATTKTDTAERSISIGRESLQVFFCTRGLGVLPVSTARG